jgi:REP element-mobilizing transposase RayT
MARKIVEISSEHPYHITARSNNQEWFDVPMGYAYAVFTNVLSKTIERYDIRVHGFVLMSNHFHLISSAPKLNLGLALRYFMTETSRGIRFKSSRINHIYGGRNYKTIIKTPEYYAHCLKYVYRNPVEAKITEKVEDYRWSTASIRRDRIHSLISEVESGHDEFLPEDHVERLKWFNEPYDEKIKNQISLALRRTEFHFKPTQNSKRLIDPRSNLPAAVTHCQVRGTHCTKV